MLGTLASLQLSASRLPRKSGDAPWRNQKPWARRHLTAEEARNLKKMLEKGSESRKCTSILRSALTEKTPSLLPDGSLPRLSIALLTPYRWLHCVLTHGPCRVLTHLYSSPLHAFLENLMP